MFESVGCWGSQDENQDGDLQGYVHVHVVYLHYEDTFPICWDGKG